MSVEQVARIKPCVVCVMPTFSRIPNQPHLIEESLQSFLNQDYDNRLLIIVNDNPTVKLDYPSDKVIVLNLAQRSPSLGEKYNYGFRYGHNVTVGKVLCMTWEDDDLMLSNHISTAVERLGDYDYWNPEARWYSDAGGLHWEHGQNQCHHASIYTIEAFDAIGHYPCISGPQDSVMDARLRTLRVSPAVLTRPSEWTYIYQWGVSENHLSGNSDSELSYINEENRCKNETTIEYELRPQWIVDYQKIVNETMEMIKCQCQCQCQCGKSSVCSC